jgi:hypothetical protein
LVKASTFLVEAFLLDNLLAGIEYLTIFAATKIEKTS